MHDGIAVDMQGLSTVELVPLKKFPSTRSPAHWMPELPLTLAVKHEFPPHAATGDLYNGAGKFCVEVVPLFAHCFESIGGGGRQHLLRYLMVRRLLRLLDAHPLWNKSLVHTHRPPTTGGGDNSTGLTSILLRLNSSSEDSSELGWSLETPNPWGSLCIWRCGDEQAIPASICTKLPDPVWASALSPGSGGTFAGKSADTGLAEMTSEKDEWKLEAERAARPHTQGSPHPATPAYTYPGIGSLSATFPGLTVKTSSFFSAFRSSLALAIAASASGTIRSNS